MLKNQRIYLQLHLLKRLKKPYLLDCAELIERI